MTEAKGMNRRTRKPRQSLLKRFNRALTKAVRAIAESPWTKFTTGVVLLTSGLDEAIDTLFTDLSSLELGAHHGVMLLGFVNVLSALPDMLDGLVDTVLLDEEEEHATAADGTSELASVLPVTPLGPITADADDVRRAA
ncbi:MAG: hypothetical protein ACO3NZ_01945 [Pirellulales bacterium]|jgi:hypothetical protein